jgi:hypothetical protein
MPGRGRQAQTYDLARQLSLQNAQFTETSTAIKQAQQQRGLGMVFGQQRPTWELSLDAK